MEAFRQDGFRFIIYPNDHLPAHVHVFKGGAEVSIFLGDSNALPSFSCSESRLQAAFTLQQISVEMNTIAAHLLSVAEGDPYLSRQTS
jgi:Domain of unknown function (DUF4160)